MKVLLALDNSKYSQAVLTEVRQIDWGQESLFKVITVLSPFEGADTPDEIWDEDFMLAKQYIDKVVSELQSALPQVQVDGQVLLGIASLRNAAHAIIQAAQENGSDLVVMGSHGRTGLNRFLLGSVSRGVLLGAPCAVRIVRGPLSYHSGEVYNVLVALDNREDSTFVLDKVLQSRWPEQTNFKLVTAVNEESRHIFLDPIRLSGLTMESVDIENNAGVSLKLAATRLNHQFGKGATTYEVRRGEPREQILNAAQKWHANLIVVGAHSRGLMGRMFIGSVSDAVVNHASCSVEVMRMAANRSEQVATVREAETV